MNIFRKVILPLATIVAFQATSVRAESVSLEPVPGGSGTIEHHIQNSAPPFPQSHTYRNREPLPNLSAPWSTSGGIWTQSTTVGYIVFDLSSVPFAVEQASIQLDLGTSEIGNVRFRAIDVLSLDYLVLLQHNENLGVTVGAQVFTELTGGTAVGAGANPASGVFSIKLDPVAVQSINNANGLWGLAMIFEFTEYPFPPAALNFNNPPKLVLSDQPPPVGC